MKLLLSIISIFTFNLVNGQDTLRTFYPNGRLSSEYPQKENKAHGRCRQWYDNGQLKQISYLDSGQASEKWTNWHFNGKLEMVRYYRGGHVIEWHTWTDKGVKTGSFKITFKTKKIRLWHDNSKKMRVEKFRNGYPLDYFETDTLLYAELHSKPSKYRQSPIKHLYTDYSGKIIVWDENGLMEREDYYKHGKLIVKRK
jgi:antitoxin component YwqK of YwqJK toxin-antitoxin module